MKNWDRKQIVSLLEESGRIAMKYKTGMSPEMKSDHTIVTRADKEIESFLDASLSGGDPDVFIIGEESIDSCDLSLALANTAFIVDPIDGTAVYAGGLPMWGISIGYAVKGKLLESAIYLPESEEIMITENGKTYLRCGNDHEFKELQPFRKEYTETGAVYITQLLAKKGTFSGAELLQSIGSCVYPGVYLAKQAYQAGIYRAKIWDVAGFLPALKNLGFTSMNREGTDLFSLEISDTLYEMNPPHLLRMKCCSIVASSGEICRKILEKCTFPGKD